MTAQNVTAVYPADASEEQAMNDICKGRYQLVFMSPKSLLTNTVH